MQTSKKTNYEEIGQRIKKLRLKLNLTQEKFSEKCNIDISSLQRIESGSGGMNTDTLISICYGANTTSDYILFGVNRYTDKTNNKNCISDFLNRSDIDTLLSIENFIKLLLKEIQTYK